MIRTEKNMKHRSSYLPISIKWMVKIALVVSGFSLWGTDFLWVLAGVYFLLPLLRGILSCLVVLLAAIALLFILLTFL